MRTLTLLPGVIFKTAAFNAPTENAVETLAPIMEAGIEYFLLYFGSPENLDTMREFARDVLPRLP